MASKITCRLVLSIALLAQFAVGVGLGSPQAKAPYATAIDADTAFERALRTGDGKLLRSTMRSKEVQGVTDAACSKFVATYFNPLWKGPSFLVGEKGKLIPWNAPGNGIVVAFQPEGGYQLRVESAPKRRIQSPAIREGNAYKSKVGFAQILFFIAAQRANSPKRNGMEEIEHAQKLFESWVPHVKSLGIQGSIDPETGRFEKWADIVKSSRAEVKALRVRYDKSKKVG